MFQAWAEYHEHILGIRVAQNSVVQLHSLAAFLVRYQVKSFGYGRVTTYQEVGT